MVSRRLFCAPVASRSLKRIDGHVDLFSPREHQVAVLFDELGWVPILGEIARKLRTVHSDLHVLAHFKVKMREIHSVVGSNGADLLPAGDVLSFFHVNAVEVRVERVDQDQLPRWRVLIDVAHDHRVAPTFTLIASENDVADADRMHWITEIAVAAAVAIPVIAKVSVRPKPTGLSIAFRD